MSSLEIFPYPHFPREAPAKVKTNRAGLKPLGGRLKGTFTWNTTIESIESRFVFTLQVLWSHASFKAIGGCHRLCRVTVLLKKKVLLHTVKSSWKPAV